MTFLNFYYTMIKQILRDAYWRRRHEKNDILLQTRYFQAHVLNVCPPPRFLYCPKPAVLMVRTLLVVPSKDIFI